MLGVAAAAIKGAAVATVAAWGAVTITDPSPGGATDHTAVTIALITGGFTFLAAALAAAAQILGPRLAAKHIEAAGEAVDVILEKLIEAEEERKAEEARKASAERHAARQAELAHKLRQELIDRGVDPKDLPPAIGPDA